jgi:hypothetical protein
MNQAKIMVSLLGKVVLSYAEQIRIMSNMTELCRNRRCYSVLFQVVPSCTILERFGRNWGVISFVAFVRLRNTGRDWGGVVVSICYYSIVVHYRCTLCNQCFKCCPGWQVQFVLFGKNGFIVFAQFY